MSRVRALLAGIVGTLLVLLSAAPVHADATPTIPATTPDLVALVRGDIEGRRFIGMPGSGSACVPAPS